MRIIESLIGYNSETKQQTLQTYLQSLKDKHKIQIHNGQFAIVLNHPNLNHVYKLWTNDAAFDKWLELCKNNSNNPAFPKFIGRTKTLPNFFIRREEFNLPIKIVKMEKLIPSPERFGNYYNIIYNAYRGNASKKKAISLLQDAHAPSQVIVFCDRVYDIVVNNINEYTTGFDLGQDNIMMRGDDLVMTDGFSEINLINIADRQITRQMDNSDFLPTLVKPSDSGKFVSGRGKNQLAIPNYSKSHPVGLPEHWYDAKAFETFDYRKFKNANTKDVFANWRNKSEIPPHNLLVYAFLQSNTGVLYYFSNKIPVDNIITAYADALSKQQFGMPARLYDVCELNKDNISKLIKVMINDYDIPLSLFSEVIDDIYFGYPLKVREIIQEEYMASDFMKTTVEHILANVVDEELQSIYELMQPT